MFPPQGVFRQGSMRHRYRPGHLAPRIVLDELRLRDWGPSQIHPQTETPARRTALHSGRPGFKSQQRLPAETLGVSLPYSEPPKIP